MSIPKRFLILFAFAAPWAAAPQRLCYLSPVDGYWQVVVRNMDGSGRQVLTRSPFDKKDPVFHPDGRRVFYSGVTEGVFCSTVPKGKPGTKAAAKSTEKAIKTEIAGIRGIRFSRDGRRTLFYRARTDIHDQSEVWLADSALQHAVRTIYRPGLQRYPDANADFSMIAYLSGRAMTGHDIWLYQVPQDKHVQITKDMVPEGAPVISPSGKSVAFPSSTLGSYNVYILDVASGDYRLLFPSEDNLLDLEWINDEALLCVQMHPGHEPALARVDVPAKTITPLAWQEEHGIRSPSILKGP
ncbi:MAG: hypothetical protein JWP91_3931 [Fibrobacteres bacterium]|nr:hypothetical protein [Fibrobacterota bacterium]